MQYRLFTKLFAATMMSGLHRCQQRIFRKYRLFLCC